jgi:hypothetical protein
MAQPEPRRRRITSAHVIALVALFVALGGGAYAVTIAPKNSVNSKSVIDESLLGKDIKNGTLTGKDVKASTLGQVPSAAQAGNANTLQGKLPKDFVRSVDYNRANFSLFDNTNDAIATRAVIDQPGGFLKVSASCFRGGAGGDQLLGGISITSSSNLWAVDSSAGASETRIAANQVRTIVQVGLSTHSLQKTAYWSAHAGNIITGLAAVQINPAADGSHECRFGYSRVGI